MQNIVLKTNCVEYNNTTHQAPNTKGAIFDLTNTTNLMYYRCINKGGNKNMTRTFIETPIFTAKWQDLGLTDKNLKDLQEILSQWRIKEKGNEVVQE